MDRPDRPSGLPPLGAAGSQQPSARGLPENPAQARRNAAGAGSALNNIPVPPIPASIPPPLRSMRSNSTLSASAPIPAAQVIALAREAMREALRDHESQAAEASGVSNELKPGITIDLSRKNIEKLPDEVVDVIKHELERLALSHNKLSSFPSRFSECSSLRYLNVRQNDIREFPLPLCDLRSLEILDLGRNKLRSLPPDIVKLASLKVFAVQKNRIEELPLCLAEMSSLQMIKLDGNPIKFPPPEVLQVQASSPPNEGYLKDSEVTEVTVTSHIKKYLKQRSLNLNTNVRVESDTGGDESSEGTETPRMPIKRVVSGRFPVKVNGTDLPDLRSPALARPPPIPTRSHYRGLSQQNTAPRRPGVMPLTIGSVNERLRSNSETLLQASRVERPGDRSRRMGIVSQKAQQLGTLDETQANNRFSHYRGLSHGSAMQTNGTAAAAAMTPKPPTSPADPILSRPIYVRRLSILPERRRESKFVDPVLEAAKGILYSIFQIHPMIQMLMSLVNDGTAKRSSLEIVFYNTNSHVEELEQEIQRHDPSAESDDPAAQYDNENVQRACVTLVNAYAHVCSLLASNVDVFIENGDPRYIRTLLVQLYNSIMELRVATSQIPPPDGPPNEGYRRSAGRAALNSDTLRPRSRESSATPTAERPGPGGMPRPMRPNLMHNPSNLRVATDVPIPSIPYINGSGRTATITSATPRSGESFVSSGSRGMSIDYNEEERMFETIFLALQKSSELVIKTLPAFNNQCGNSLQSLIAQRGNPRDAHCWKILINKCSVAIQQTEQLKMRLSMIKLKEPGIRTQAYFWNLCRNFIDSWTEFGSRVKEFMPVIPLPPDTRVRLRPIQKSIQETTDLIIRSPWGYALRAGAMANSSHAHLFSPGGASVNGSVHGGHEHSNSSPLGPHPLHPLYAHQGMMQQQLPMTPQSAALGPAVQATVPATPQSASFANAFSGNVFERADALISHGGPSMSSLSLSSTSSSRHGTFTSSNSGGGSFSGLNSINSTLSSVNGNGGYFNGNGNGDVAMMSSSAPMGPGPVFSPLPMRMHNGGGKVAL